MSWVIRWDNIYDTLPGYWCGDDFGTGCGFAHLTDDLEMAARFSSKEDAEFLIKKTGMDSWHCVPNVVTLAGAAN